MTQKEKAEAYDGAIEKAKKELNTCGSQDCDAARQIFRLFPELCESKDEKTRKRIIALVNAHGQGMYKDDMLAWLENIPYTIDHEKREGFHLGYKAGLEKQGEEEQLYIRFGEIPTDEKSKIYRGEIEVGTENGVSVYPAFKTNEGDIVLGLNLPITKTTLYTQQHLIEYDDRPCYLVKGDYVGKDTDGQTLINNVSIIEKIDTYRLKEKKQGEQKPTLRERYKNIAESEWFKKTHEGMSVSDDEKVDSVNKIEQKPAWSEEDEEHYQACLQYFDAVNPDMVYYKDYQWLKSLKERIGE